MSSLSTLSALLALRQHHAPTRTVTFDIPEDWQQGRTAFGGLIATLAVQAMRDVAGAGWDPTVRLRALQTSFIGPVDRGPLEVVVQVLREGKHVRQVQALVQQNGRTAALHLGVFASPRDTVVPALAPAQPAVARALDHSMPMPFVRGVAPNFLQHFDLRWSEGVFPYSGSDDSWHSRIHLRLRSEPVHPELLTVLLADMPPSPVISCFHKPTPSSSVSWELELRPVTTAGQDGAWWRVDTDVIAAEEGYVNQVSKLWTPAGELASLGYQVVTVYG